MKIGFIGTGTISAAMVHGLQLADPPHPVVLSPRSEAVSRALSDRYPDVTVATSNAAVAAQSDIVVLGMRPAQVEEALAGVTFRPDHIVVSLVAGLALAEVQKRAPRSRACRCVPLPGIARRQGPVTLYPDVPEVSALLRPLGDLIVAASETELNMGGLSAFMSSYFELQAALIGRAVDAGVSEALARTYVTSLLAMLAETGRTAGDEAFPHLVAEHQTRGGLNERVRAHLLAQGWFDGPATAFEAIASLNWRKLG